MSFNYGQSQISKLNPNDPWRIKIISVNDDKGISGETHWMNLTPKQAWIIAELIVLFKKE